ncbi:hypothetical protein D3C76_942040 [compost metagenome]
MLLAGLQGHAQGHIATRILGHTDDASGNGALEFVATSKIRRMRPAIAHRYAKTLGSTEDHVGTQLTRRGQQYQAEQVCRDTGQCLLVMQLFDQRPQIVDFAMGVGVLQQGTEYLVLAQVIHRVDGQLEPKAFGASPHNGERLRVAVLIDEEHIAFRFGHAFGQGHGLGSRRGLVEQ